MSQDECPNLQEVYGEEFNKLYNQYVSEHKYRKKVAARDLMRHICNAQLETGMPYFLFKDSCNKKSNQNNIGTIKLANLCTEIVQYTSGKISSICNLASINLTKFVLPNIQSDNILDHYDFLELEKISYIICKSLNRVIDVQYYTYEESKKQNIEARPIGIGVQGLANVFFKLKLPYTSLNARILNSAIFEVIYYGAIKCSIDLAKEFGPYKFFENSMYSKGILQFDL